MSQSPQKAAGSRNYKEGWRAVNELIRQGGSWSGRERNVAYRNLGGGRFEDVSYVSGLDFSGDGRAMAAFDYDHDGRMDLALTFRTGPRLRLLRNENIGAGTALQLELAGVTSNRDAVGARVRLKTGRRTLHRHVRSGSGFLSQSSRRVHFGLQEGERAEAIEIDWPSGKRQRIVEPPAAGLYRIVEGGEIAPLAARPAPVRPAAERAAASVWLASPVPLPEKVELAGAWTLVSFYGDWCPPCRAEMEEWKGRGLPLRIVDVDKSPMGAWNILRRGLFDYREDLALPSSLLLDRLGRAVKFYRGVTRAETILADMRAAVHPSLPFPGLWLQPPAGRNYGELATAFAEAGLLEPAARYFALAKPDEETRVNYAALLLEQRRGEEAESILAAVLRANPSQPEALANLGLRRLGQERFREAAEIFERLPAGDGAAMEWLGMARIGLGEPGPAIAAFEAARRLGRETADLLNHLAILYAETGRKAEALALFQRAVERYPAHEGLKENLRRLSLQK